MRGSATAWAVSWLSGFLASMGLARLLAQVARSRKWDADGHGVGLLGLFALAVPLQWASPPLADTVGGYLAGMLVACLRLLPCAPPAAPVVDSSDEAQRTPSGAG